MSREELVRNAYEKGKEKNMNEYEKPPFGSTVSIPYKHLWQVEVFTNCKNHNEWIERHDKEIYNLALEDLVKLVCEYYTMQEKVGYCADTNNMIKQRIADFAEQLKR